MDRDEGKRRPGNDENYGADPEGAAPAGAAAAEYGQDQAFGAEGNWEQEPVDDFVDEAEVHEAIYDDELAEPTAATVKEDEQNAHIDEAAEEEYYQQLPEEEKAALVAEARSKKVMSSFGEKAFLKRYLPYIGGGAFLLLLGFFGFQQMFAVKARPGPVQFPKMAKSTDNNSDEPIDNPDNERNRALTQSEHKEMAYAEPEALAPAAPPEPPPAEKLDTNPPKPLGPDIITPVAAPPQAPPTLESKLADLTTQLQEIKDSQQQIRQDIETKSADQAASAAKALEERMAQLEERMNTMSVSKPAPARAAPSTDAPSREEAATAPAADSTPVLPAPQKEAKEEHKHTAATHREPRHAKKDRPSTDFMASQLQREMNSGGGVSKTPTSPPPQALAMARPPVPVYTPPPPERSGGWVLRSAQPGAAWISEGMSSRLRRIVPGDKVPGLGTIISVHQFAGHWVIEGTQGSVH